MADDRWLIITPTDIRLATSEPPDNSVIMMVDVSHEETGLAPGVHLGLRMSPTEARQLAAALVRRADAAEGE